MKVAKSPVSSSFGWCRQAMIVLAGLVLFLFGAGGAAAQTPSTPSTESGEASQGAAKALSDLMEAEADPEERRLSWEPQFGFGFGVLSQSHDGNTTQPPNGVGFDRVKLEDSGDSLISEFFDFSLYLYSPLQLDLPLKPRFLFTSAFQIPIAKDLISNRIDRGFNLSGLNSDPVAFAANCPEFMTDADGNVLIDTIDDANGTGPISPDTCSTVVRNRTTPLALWSLGVGTDLTLPFDEEQFHIVTTLDYVGMAIQAEGYYKRTTTSQNPQALDAIIESVDAVGDAEIFHGLSSSIRLAIDAYEEDAWTWQVYVSGRVSYFFANEDLTASGSTGLGRFDFVSEVDGMMYQIFTGFTVRFDPSFK